MKSAFPLPVTVRPSLAASTLEAIRVTSRSPEAEKSNEYRTVRFNDEPAGMYGVLPLVRPVA